MQNFKLRIVLLMSLLMIGLLAAARPLSAGEPGSSSAELDKVYSFSSAANTTFKGTKLAAVVVCYSSLSPDKDRLLKAVDDVATVWGNRVEFHKFNPLLNLNDPRNSRFLRIFGIRNVPTVIVIRNEHFCSVPLVELSVSALTKALEDGLLATEQSQPTADNAVVKACQCTQPAGTSNERPWSKPFEGQSLGGL